MGKGRFAQWLTPEGRVLLEGWARDGMTEEQIAAACGVSPRTLRRWKSAHEEIAAALRRGADVADYEVENALFEKAVGGCTTAQIFWLKNRKPRRWREKPGEVAPPPESGWFKDE